MKIPPPSWRPIVPGERLPGLTREEFLSEIADCYTPRGIAAMRELGFTEKHGLPNSGMVACCIVRHHGGECQCPYGGKCG